MTLSAVVDTNIARSDEAGASLGRRIVLGVDTGAGHRLRVPLSVNADSSVQCIGQIARSEGQMSGFHNCTAVVCVIPE